MALTVTINETDVSKSIKRNSFTIENIITRQVDRCQFTLRKYGSTHTFEPIVGQEIIVLNNGIKIFGGIIVKFDLVSDDNAELLYKITCNDFTRKLDRFLINNSFVNQTITEIINFIVVDKGLDGQGFTTNNVVGDTIIEFISFKYEQFSSVLAQLADRINFDWYVDYDKDIHFFAKNQSAASFDIEDTTGSYLTGSLIVRKDNSQVKNVIIVRGGDYLANTFTSEVISDGIENVHNLPYRYDELQVNVTGSIWDGGIDTIDVADQFDYMWNEDEKFIRFRGDRIPNDTSSIRISGPPFFPVIVKQKDEESIATLSAAEGGNGEYEYLIVDKTINSRAGARERGSAELASYKDTLVEAEFSTYNSGLIAGQEIRINSTLYGIDDKYIINKVIYKMYTEDTFQYQVSLVSTKTLGIIDFLRDLLLRENKQIVINDNEVLDEIVSKNEALEVSDTVTASIEHNLQSEAIDMTETFTAQSLDFPTKFVAGPFTPTGDKRVFLITGSRLG